MPPGGAEQSQASERPGSRQVSAPKEAWSVSVSHKSGEGSFLFIIINIITFFQGLSSQTLGFYLAYKTYFYSSRRTNPQEG